MGVSQINMIPCNRRIDIEAEGKRNERHTKVWLCEFIAFWFSLITEIFIRLKWWRKIFEVGVRRQTTCFLTKICKGLVRKVNFCIQYTAYKELFWTEKSLWYAEYDLFRLQCFLVFYLLVRRKRKNSYCSSFVR